MEQPSYTVWSSWISQPHQWEGQIHSAGIFFLFFSFFFPPLLSTCLPSCLLSFSSFSPVSQLGLCFSIEIYFYAWHKHQNTAILQANVLSKTRLGRSHFLFMSWGWQAWSDGTSDGSSFPFRRDRWLGLLKSTALCLGFEWFMATNPRGYIFIFLDVLDVQVVYIGKACCLLTQAQ